MECSKKPGYKGYVDMPSDKGYSDMPSDKEYSDKPSDKGCPDKLSYKEITEKLPFLKEIYTEYEYDQKKFNRDIYTEAKKRWDNIAKPIDGMGIFEDITAKISAIKGDLDFDLKSKALVIMCADNGIVKEGVSQSEPQVTVSVMKNMVKGRSSVTVMAHKNSIDTFIIDVGVESKECISGCIYKRIRCGTRDFVKEKAMTEEECVKAIEIGINTVRDLKNKGYDIIATGEMGIGNTTTSSAIVASILKLNVEDVTGRGAGLDDDRLARKIAIIKDAIRRYGLYEADAIKVLECVGGFDIAALSGVCIGGYLYDIPIVTDGLISLTAALLAEKIMPNVKDCLIASHVGKEKGCRFITDELSLKAAIDAKLCLGEGTGAIMMLSLLDDALCVYKNASDFSSLNMDSYERYT